jgi:lipopolysaccharide exporter
MKKITQNQSLMSVFYTVLSQLVGFLTIFLTVKIFSAQDFGIFSYFTSIVGIFGTIATFRLDLTYLKSDTSDSKSVISLFLVISGMFSAILTLIYFAFQFFFGENYSLPYINTPIFWFALFSFSLFNFSNVIPVKSGSIVISGMIKLIQAVVFLFTVLISSYLNLGYAGIILSSSFSYLIPASWLFKNNLSRKIFTLAREHYETIKYSYPSAIINVFSFQMPLILIFWLYGAKVSASSAIIYRLIGILTTLLAQSLGNSFTSYMVNQSEFSLHEKFKKYIRITLFLGITATVSLILASRYLYKFIGDEYQTLPTLAISFSTIITAQFCSVPFLQVLHITNQSKWQLKWDTTRLIITLTVVSLLKYYNFSVENNMLIFNLLLTGLFLTLIYQISNSTLNFDKRKLIT